MCSTASMSRKATGDKVMLSKCKTSTNLQITRESKQLEPGHNWRCGVWDACELVDVLSETGASPSYISLCASARRCGVAAAASMLYSSVRWSVMW